MIDKDNKSIMQMHDIYFAEIKFLQNKNTLGEVNLNVEHSLNYERNCNEIGRAHV